MKSKDLSKFSIRSDIALDLIDINNSQIDELKELYEKLGYKVLFISAKEKINLDELKE